MKRGVSAARPFGGRFAAVAAAAAVAMAASVGGCSSTRALRPPDRPADESTGEPRGPLTGMRAAERFVAGRRDAVPSVRAGLEIEWLSPDTAGEASCRGTLSFAAPDRVRLRGTSAAFFTVFELVAGRDSIFVDVPREEVLVAGSRTDPAWEEFTLTPELLAAAILAIPSPASAGLAEWSETGGAVIGRWDGAALEFDPSTGLPRALDLDDGRIRIEWSDWHLAGGVDWPRRLRIERKGAGEEVRIEFGRVQIGGPIRGGSFDERPEGRREVLEPGEGLGRWKSALDQAGEAPPPR